VSRPISSASPDGGTGRASSPRAISSERASSVWIGSTTSRTTRPVSPTARASPTASTKPAGGTWAPGVTGALAKSASAPQATAATIRNEPSSFGRSPTRERIFATGSTWRDPMCRISGPSARRMARAT
jgi:hypothetical protein